MTRMFESDCMPLVIYMESRYIDYLRSGGQPRHPMDVRDTQDIRKMKKILVNK